MSMLGSRRCFECGPTFNRSGQAAPIYCRNDGSLLAPEVVGRRWRVEGYLGPRTGGGIFIAYHQVTSQRVALSLVYETPGRDFEERLQREVGAQRMLEPHPNLFPMLELGSDREGIRFFASRLGAEQPLQLALREWQRPAEPAQCFAQAAAIIQPLLKLLHSAHRQDIAHGTLDTTQLYVTLSDGDVGESTLLSEPRLYGLRRIGAGPALSDAMRADLTSMGQIFFQLVFGQPALMPIGAEQRLGIVRVLGEGPGQFLLRSLGCLPADGDGPGRFASADDMLRELQAVRSGVSSGEHKALAPDVPQPDTCEERTIPGTSPSRLSLDRRMQRAEPARSAQSLQGPQPLPEVPAGSTNRLSSISGELHRVSFIDLLSGNPQRAPQNEVVARSRHRMSLDGLSHMPVATVVPSKNPNRPSERSLEVELEIETAPVDSAAVVALEADEPSSPPAICLEPTQDLRTRMLTSAPRDVAYDDDAPAAGATESADALRDRPWLRGMLRRSTGRIWKR